MARGNKLLLLRMLAMRLLLPVRPLPMLPTAIVLFDRDRDRDRARARASGRDRDRETYKCEQA